MEPAACECKTNTLVLIMSIKPKPAVAATPSTDSREARSNPEIDGKIDAYIRQNPKHWEFLEATPKDRLQRMLIWKEVQALDRQQRVREGVMRDINLNPEMKQAYDTILRNVPEDQRETVMTQLASQTRRVIARSQRVDGQQP